MGFWSSIFRTTPTEQQQQSGAFEAQVAGIVKAYGDFFSLDDPALAEFMRSGKMSSAGITVSEDRALNNPAVFRSVSLLSQTIGMLPLHLIDKNTKEKAEDHPVFMILHRRPNDYQTAYLFRQLMQLNALVKGDAFARIIRGAASGKIMRLIPLNPDWMEVKQNVDWTLRYEYRPSNGAKQVFSSRDILHVRGITRGDGIRGISLLKVATDVIGIALAAELAAARWLKNGSIVSGWLETGGQLSDPAYARLRESWDSRYVGADNAGGTPILEQGLTYKTPTMTMREAQYNELRARQVEEIARVFGTPRPLLMVDDTSWGTGIEVLGEAFVRYGLNPWFETWQQACEMSLLTDAEQKLYELKFNPGALTRGSLKDQGEFFAKALGSGGGKPFMTANEVRGLLDMPAHADGDMLAPPATDPAAAGIGHNGGPPLDGQQKAA